MKINKEEWLKASYEYPFKGKEASDTPRAVEHADHYNKGNIETIDVIEDWGLNFHCGNAVKYIARHMHKGEAKQDIRKAIWYLKRYLEKL